jgi:hypothetical protein
MSATAKESCCDTIHIIGKPADSVKSFSLIRRNIYREATMPTKRNGNTNGAMKKSTAVWQSSWMMKVMSNGYNAQAKLVFLRIASFGERGCYMNNETICEELGRSERTIRRAISALWSKGDLIITGWNGHGRKMYASKHPRVKAELNRQFYELQGKGKVASVEEWRKKARLRQEQGNPQN